MSLYKLIREVEIENKVLKFKPCDKQSQNLFFSFQSKLFELLLTRISEDELINQLNEENGLGLKLRKHYCTNFCNDRFKCSDVLSYEGIEFESQPLRVLDLIYISPNKFSGDEYLMLLLK